VAALTASVAEGEVLSVMGPSGSGKSTLIALATGTLDPAFEASGRVLLRGRDLTGLPPQARRVGVLFQDDLLFPHLSVGGNLAFGLPPDLRGRAARRAAVAAALAEAGLEGFAERDPATLSGGQRARVALMRALLSRPQALLLDEPFSRLDAMRRDRIRRFVFDHAKERGLPVVLVTHDVADATAAGGEVIRLDAPR
jgi:putative thiamine transport system ATP-binding protein